MARRPLRPTVHVSRSVSPDTAISRRQLKRLARDYDIEGLHFVEPRIMAATIIDSREVLELYNRCGVSMSGRGAAGLGSILKKALPQTAIERARVPLSLTTESRLILDQSLQHSIIAAPCTTAVHERAALQEALIDTVVDRVGSLAAARAITYTWPSQLHGAQLVTSHDEQAVKAFYGVLQEGVDRLLPRTIAYDRPRVYQVMA